MKVYEYTVSEVNDKQTGITYDEREFKVTVKVSDNGEGTLSAETGSDDIVFTNSYKVPKDGKTTDTPQDKPDKTDETTGSPKTGDNSNITLWIAVMLAAGAALTGTAVYSKKRRQEQ